MRWCTLLGWYRGKKSLLTLVREARIYLLLVWLKLLNLRADICKLTAWLKAIYKSQARILEQRLGDKIVSCLTWGDIRTSMSENQGILERFFSVVRDYVVHMAWIWQKEYCTLTLMRTYEYYTTERLETGIREVYMRGFQFTAVPIVTRHDILNAGMGAYPS